MCAVVTDVLLLAEDGQEDVLHTATAVATCSSTFVAWKTVGEPIVNEVYPVVSALMAEVEALAPDPAPAASVDERHREELIHSADPAVQERIDFSR